MMADLTINTLVANVKIMDLDKRRGQLESEIKHFEQAEKEAHEEILKRRAKLRKLAIVVRDAEELFDDKSGINAIETHD